MANSFDSTALNSSTGSFNVELDQLPKAQIWDVLNVYKWEGVWLHSEILNGTLALRSHFEARDDDVVLASSIKTGTTWLKALCTCIMGRAGKGREEEEGAAEDILTKKNPHACVPILEADIYMKDPRPDLSSTPSPRLFHTHLPYHLLPDSIKSSKCKIVYITRNPKDTFVSLWHHFSAMFQPFQSNPVPLAQEFDHFCDGISVYGPFFDHVLGYWKEKISEVSGPRILFLKYEEIKRDPRGEVKRLASFLGRPFETDEDVDRVLWRCSLERLKGLEVNKNGTSPWSVIPNSLFFREGVVGGWKKYLTPEMEDRLDQITRQKLDGTGLDL